MIFISYDMTPLQIFVTSIYLFLSICTPRRFILCFTVLAFCSLGSLNASPAQYLMDYRSNFNIGGSTDFVTGLPVNQYRSKENNFCP
jgi:hypothetical protein